MHICLGSSSGALVPVLCDYLCTLLSKSTKYLNVVQEAGLVNMVGLMLTFVTESPTSGFTKQVIAHFNSVMDCIIAMTSIPSNMAIFHKSQVALAD